MFTQLEPERHWGCRINDQITWHGYKAILMQNELIQLVILVDKGAEIVQFLYKPLDIDFLWHSANPIHHPSKFVPAGASAATSFFDHWTGGWFEVLPNGGPGCVYKGAELGNFAETINLPWEYSIKADSPECVSVDLWVKTYRTPFLLQKSLTLKSGAAVLYIKERVTNLGNELIDFMWGHHPVVGAPFLDENCRLYAPASKVEIFNDEDGPDYRMGLFQISDWPMIKDRNGNALDLRQMPPRNQRTMDNCYLKEFLEGWIAIYNPVKEAGFGLSWDAQVFRYIWIWQALGGGIGYPWYGRTYNMGIEPWSSYPCAGLVEAINRGTHLQLPPGESLDVWLNAVAFTKLDPVNKIDQAGVVS